MKYFRPEYIDELQVDFIRTNKQETYGNIPCGFDIETTSTTLSDGQKTAFSYVWTFGIGTQIWYGRTWNEFLLLCENLSEKLKLKVSFDKKGKPKADKVIVCYVHNLAYEFQFMRNYFNWVNVFSVDERKPIKALCDLGIEFKDSYILSGFSLDRLAKNLTSHKVEKLKGNLDYSLIRHSKTELTELELQYCKNDVLIILYYITEQINLYGDITKIPLTNTGRVRQYVRNKCYYTNKNHRKSSRGKRNRYLKIMEDLQVGKDDYTILRRAFMGGFTHANANYTGKVLKDVTSIDFTSSYPSVMLSEKFPMSQAIKTELTEEHDLNYYRENFGLVFDIRFTNISAKVTQDNYISESKCFILKNPIKNNGRVFSADDLGMTITDVDLDIIERCYSWDSIEVKNVYRFNMGYLPKPIIESVIKLYADKTTLKDVEGKEVEYLVSKGMLNSTYGMTVTDIVRDDIEYTNNEWTKQDGDFDKQLEKYNKSKTRFLYYAWGVWITAYSRKNLWTGIYTMKEDYIYSDTDSVKFLNYDKHKPYIEKYNNMIESKLKNMCEWYNIDYKELTPKTKYGVEKPIGVWDLDGEYTRFKTLGAKRYLVEFSDGNMQLTVAGLSKKNGLDYMIKTSDNDNNKVFDMFNDGLYIPSCETGKMTHTYIDEKMDFMMLDYNGVENRVTTLSGVHLGECEFSLSQTDEYIKFMENLLQGYLFTGMKNK